MLGKEEIKRIIIEQGMLPFVLSSTSAEVSMQYWKHCIKPV
jgi:hypothetical protein